MNVYPVENAIVYDLEVYPNYFLAGFQFPDGEVYQFDQTLTHELMAFLDWVRYSDHTLAGFNSKGYDDPVLSEFLASPTPETAYDVSQRIIYGGEAPWNFRNTVYSVDLMQILPGRVGLKNLGVRLHHPLLQELPIRFDKDLTEQEKQVIRSYNVNDLKITRRLYDKLLPELELRSDLSSRYQIDLRSKGEAAIAEMVLLAETGGDKKALNETAWANVSQNSFVELTYPSWWHLMRETASRYPSLSRVIDKADTVYSKQIPLNQGRLQGSVLSDYLYLGDRFYTLGIGGLHSVDGAGCWEEDHRYALIDIDVASYYPAIMLTQKYGPRHWREKFQEVYQSIVDRRLAAKRNGDKVTASVLKIVANGTYGKTAEPYSALFDPWVTAHVTVTGQISLLCLIAMLHDEGVITVSANTDGLTVKCPKNRIDDMKKTICLWEEITGFEMEYTDYRKLAQLDVNNYIAVTTDNKLKLKGRFNAPPIGEYDLRHSPNFNICALAIQDLMRYGTPIESTVYGCADINQFILTQQVTGNWRTEWDGQPMGKMLRWYKSTSPQAQPIYRYQGEAEKGNIVANSEGAIPLENLPDRFPGDIDYNWYIETAFDWWSAISRPKTPGGNRSANEWMEKGFHPIIIDRTSERRTRKKPARGSLDFTSLGPTEAMAIRTGDGVIAVVNSQGYTVGIYKTDRDYPSKTRAKILKDEGFELVYGGAVLPGTVYPEIVNWDEYYTNAELRKVGR